MDNLDVRLLENEALGHAISPHSSSSPLKNVCERLQRLLQPIARKKDLISMYRGPVVIGL